MTPSRMAIGLLLVLLAVQLLAHWISSSDGAVSIAGSEVPEPARLLSGDVVPSEVRKLMPDGPAVGCRILVFGSATCPGCAALAEVWDHGRYPKPLWILEGDDAQVSDFSERFALLPETTIRLPREIGLTDVGIYASPTWGFLDSGGRIWHVRGSSRPPDPELVVDACR